MEVAAHFHAASDMLPGTEVEKRRNYQDAEAEPLYRQGCEKGDNYALRQAIDLYGALLEECRYANTTSHDAVTTVNGAGIRWVS